MSQEPLGCDFFPLVLGWRWWWGWWWWWQRWLWRRSRKRFGRGRRGKGGGGVRSSEFVEHLLHAWSHLTLKLTWWGLYYIYSHLQMRKPSLKEAESPVQALAVGKLQIRSRVQNSLICVSKRHRDLLWLPSAGSGEVSEFFLPHCPCHPINPTCCR